MKAPPNKYRVREGMTHFLLNLAPFASDDSYGNNGLFLLPRAGRPVGSYFKCIISNGDGWEHVSVTIIAEKRTPTWEEMCYIKDQFFDENEVVVQYHPAKSDYINNHPFCLHLWKPISVNFPVPPPIMVGI